LTAFITIVKFAHFLYHWLHTYFYFCIRVPSSVEDQLAYIKKCRPYSVFVEHCVFSLFFLFSSSLCIITYPKFVYKEEDHTLLSENTFNVLIYIKQDATLHSLFYLETALHVSGGTTTHHQKRKQLYLRHLVFVRPLLLPAATAAGSSNGITNTRCRRYSCLRS